MSPADKDIRPPDDFEADEVSAYRRRPKAVPVRSRRFARLRWVLRLLLVAVFVLLPTGYVGYHVTVFALTSSLFALRSPADIVVEGGHYVSAEDVSSALGVPGTPAATRRAGGVNILRLSLPRAKRDVESIPWVRSAAVRRAFPHRLTVRVEERVPVAFMSVDGRIKLIDSEGVVLERPEKATFDFPVIAGLEGASLEERKARLDLYQQFSHQVAGQATSGWMVSEVNLADGDDLRAVMVQGNQTVELHFGNSDFEQRFHNFLTLLPELNKANTKFESMDLRYRNQIVVNPQANSRVDSAASAPVAGTQKE